jgi:hypothetical protein
VSVLLHFSARACVHVSIYERVCAGLCACVCVHDHVCVRVPVCTRASV